MSLDVTYETITIDDVLALSARKKADGYRFVQLLCVNTEQGIDVQYTYGKGSVLENYTILGVASDDVIPSITGDWFNAFVFENEVHDLFGVTIENIVIDFGGNFYAVSQKEPMTIISPELKAAREKAAKIAAAKAAKLKTKHEKVGKESDAAAANASYRADHPEDKPKQERVIAPPSEEELNDKLKGLDPEKVARVKAAIAAKAKKAAQTQKQAAEGKDGE